MERLRCDRAGGFANCRQGWYGGCRRQVADESQTKGIVIATSKKVTAKAEPIRVRFSHISLEPKVWGLLVPKDQAKKGLVVEAVNKWGAVSRKVLVAKAKDVAPNPVYGTPASELWYFQDAK
jgi:hypothetical protein